MLQEKLHKIYTFFDYLIGFDLARAELSWLNMGSRAIVIYILGIVIVRVSTQRIQGKPTAFDIMLFLILGSVMSRAINGDSPFFPTIVTTVFLIVTHYFFSIITYYSSRSGVLLKGKPIVLIEDGQILWQNMRRNFITANDLLSSLRLKGGITDPAKVKLAVLERNGEISVITYDKHGKTHNPINIYVSHDQFQE